MAQRKNPREIIESIMNSLNSDPKTIEAVSNEIDSSWITAYKYLELIFWIQQCPKVSKVKVSPRMELWRREWGKIPE